MKRFIDIRGQGTGYRFCWFDTIHDQIEHHSGQTVWNTFAEFEEDFDDNNGEHLSRYRHLAPEWTFVVDEKAPLWKDEDAA